ncbi:MAG: neutral/alkaline non-lysosomal ceramidase N-terminal domain-containing protein [Bacillota bacterium]|nr:neutral/alkaline non-lysosomal ceramidase N-terminal domain-containing protein [Bacillota bacterium]
MFKAGAGMIDITPVAGTHLAGAAYGEYRPAEMVLDPLYAKAVVIQSDQVSLCIVTLDVIIITEKYCEKIRSAVVDLYGFSHDAIMVHAIQTHSAPGVGGFMFDQDHPVGLTPETEFLNGGETAYSEFASDKAIQAVTLAMQNMRPASLGVGRSLADHLAFNRRLVTRKGSVVMPGLWSTASQPLGPADLLYYEGPTDPEVAVLCLRDDHMDMIAMLLHFTCHPVNVFSTVRSWNAVSSDWPGVWTKEVQNVFGPSCVPLVLNGCCGNLNPWDPFAPDFVADHRRMGKRLYQVTENIIKKMRFQATSELDFRSSQVALDYRQIPEQRQAEVDQIIGEHPQVWFDDPMRQKTDNRWFLAASTKSIEFCKIRMPSFLYEVQAFRIGQTVVVGWPGEPFVEAQLALKTMTPAQYTMVAHCTAQYVGYLPTADAYARGGHEANPDCTYWAKLAPGSLERVTTFTKDLIRTLYQQEQ